MKKFILTVIMAICFAFASFSQLYIGYAKEKIDEDIASSIVSSVITTDGDSYTQSVVFADGHFGVYNYSVATNTCLTYMLGFYDKDQFNALMKSLKKTFDKAKGYKDTWIENRIGYLCAISEFKYKNAYVLAVYPVQNESDIDNIRTEILKILEK